MEIYAVEGEKVTGLSVITVGKKLGLQSPPLTR
jgi:hypothetical protein